MNRPTLAILGAVVFAAASALTAHAQETQSAQPAPTAPPAAATSPAPPAQPPAKKVWTNDDMTDLHGRSAISMVGNANPNAVKPASRPSTAPRGKNAQSYHDQIAKLQAQLPPLDEKITQLQAAISGNQVNEVRKYGWTQPGDWKDQLASLQKQRDGIQAKIAALEDEARHSGVPANQIP